MRHDALLYDSDQQFLDVVLPYLREGLDAGEYVMVNATEYNRALVEAALGGEPRIAYQPLVAEADNPARLMTAFVRTLERELARGARGVRAVGQLYCGEDVALCRGWARYEAAANEILGPYPVSALCPYDRRSASATALDGAERTHPTLVTPEGRAVSPRFEDPAEFFRRSMAEAPPDPLEVTEPVLTKSDVTDLALVRDEVYLAAVATELSGDDLDDFVFAVSEAVTNALQHGGPPVTLTLWSAPRRLVCVVGDRGPGIGDPLAGCAPPSLTRPTHGGIGLWMARQLCDTVTWSRDGDEFRVRLTAGT